MMVGPTGVGKTAAWKLLLDCMERVDKVKGESYVVDPKAINKDELYGKLDSTTAEWTDGVFTGILRRIIGNERGEAQKRHWIIFDGDVDPEWAENLNSVLDDNKLLTLPSGERLQMRMRPPGACCRPSSRIANASPRRLTHVQIRPPRAQRKKRRGTSNVSANWRSRKIGRGLLR